MQQPMERQQGATTMAHICFNHLTKRYGPVVAVDDVTATLQPGKITGFLGPNGAVTDCAVFHPRRSGRDALRVLCALGSIPPRRADEVIDLVDLTAAGGRN